MSSKSPESVVKLIGLYIQARRKGESLDLLRQPMINGLKQALNDQTNPDLCRWLRLVLEQHETASCQFLDDILDLIKGATWEAGSTCLRGKN